MFGLGIGEIIVILVVALLVLGPDKLPDAARQIGKTIRELRKHTDSLKETIEQDEHIGGTVREIKSALRGDLYSPQRHIMKPVGEVIAQAPKPEVVEQPVVPASTPVVEDKPKDG